MEAGVAGKTLSLDPDDGSITMLLRMPAGFVDSWQIASGEYREFLVLDGSVQVGADTYLTHGYGFRARSDGAFRVATDTGATLLLMSGPLATATPDIAIRTAMELPWKFGAEGSVTGKPLGGGIATKLLRRDANTGELSFLYTALPHHPPPTVMVGKFTHPVIEEVFTLHGSYVFGDTGRMGPGGYVFWREQQWHGPAGSATGYLLFIRVLGGALSNIFSPTPAPFSFHPPYRPELPAELQALAREYVDHEPY